MSNPYDKMFTDGPSSNGYGEGSRLVHGLYNVNYDQRQRPRFGRILLLSAVIMGLGFIIRKVVMNDPAIHLMIKQSKDEEEKRQAIIDSGLNYPVSFGPYIEEKEFPVDTIKKIEDSYKSVHKFGYQNSEQARGQAETTQNYLMTEKPGDGIRSLRTSNAFRVLNFELYAKPNKIIMGLGLICLIGCSGYIFYMRRKYKNMGYTPVITESGQEVYTRKTSKWER